jgi:cellulose synthase/poly-beta-1,6-N-acetylglucosamine synthase-like glycosyltransferase
MNSFVDITFYIFTFLAIYTQVFFLVTFLENRKRIIIRYKNIKLNVYSKVTIIVPCWNEEKTIYKTVRSIQNLNYPKDKVKIFLVDDGSTDGTWDILQEFTKYSNVKIFHKENGGKHTALNLGLAHVETEYVGCLDADSFADRESLVRIMSYFEKDINAMAVSPSIIVHNPKGVVQRAQKAEYNMSVFIKKMLAFLGAIHVTPGPLTIFKKKVFDDLGPYRSAHNTEDMEIAYRMQKHHYAIEQCNDAYIYTNAPSTVKKLYRQRLRWIYGFINNTIDYRNILFKKKYGNFSTFTVPAGIISVISVCFLFGMIVYNLIHFIYLKILQFRVAGFQFSTNTHIFDTFFINTQTIVFVTLFLYSLVIVSIILGHRMVNKKWGISINMLYYFTLFSVIAPIWLIKAVYVTILSRKPAWR